MLIVESPRFYELYRKTHYPTIITEEPTMLCMMLRGKGDTATGKDGDGHLSQVPYEGAGKSDVRIRGRGDTPAGKGGDSHYSQMRWEWKRGNVFWDGVRGRTGF